MLYQETRKYKVFNWVLEKQSESRGTCRMLLLFFSLLLEWARTTRWQRRHMCWWNKNEPSRNTWCYGISISFQSLLICNLQSQSQPSEETAEQTTWRAKINAHTDEYDNEDRLVSWPVGKDLKEVLNECRSYWCLLDYWMIRIEIVLKLNIMVNIP